MGTIKDTKYNYGVDNPLQVVRSNKYVFWLNKNGVYGYDGNEYYNFIKGKIDLEELKNHGMGDTLAKNSSGANAGYTPAKTTKGDGKLHEEKSQLQERFQKLANIIK